MEENRAARSQVPDKPTQHSTWIGLVVEHEATNHEIEWLIEHHFRWIALQE